MLIIIIFTICVMAGVTTVILALLKDNKEQSTAVPISPDTLNIETILSQEGGNSKHSVAPSIGNNMPTVPPTVPTLKERLESTQGTPSITTNSTPAETKTPDINNSSKNTHEEHDKLNKLLAEKNKIIEKYELEIQNERMHRREFDKVKNLLEEELHTVKENTKVAEKELQDAKSKYLDMKEDVKGLKDELSKLNSEKKPENLSFENFSKKNEISTEKI